MWLIDLPLMVRNIINDLDKPYTYSDSRIQLSILISAKFVKSELSFNQNYKIDLTEFSLSPDPTLESTLDDWFSMLIALKTAIFILQNELKAASSQSFYFREGSSIVDLRQNMVSKKGILDTLLKMYEQAKLEYQMGVRVSGSVVFSTLNIYGSSRNNFYRCQY